MFHDELLSKEVQCSHFDCSSRHVANRIHVSFKKGMFSMERKGNVQRAWLFLYICMVICARECFV